MPVFYVTAKWEVLGEIKVEARDMKEALEKVQDTSPEALQLYLKEASVIDGTVKPCPDLMADLIKDNICDLIVDMVNDQSDKKQLLFEMVNCYMALLNPEPSSSLEVFDKVLKKVSEQMYRIFDAEGN
jgi:hypothetical protein